MKDCLLRLMVLFFLFTRVLYPGCCFQVWGLARIRWCLCKRTLLIYDFPDML